MSNFTLEIKLGNAEMRTPEDVAEALREIAEQLGTGTGRERATVRDANGNAVGSWEAEWPTDDE